MREKEYNYSVVWSEEDRLFIGRVAEFRSLSAHGKTPEAALREIMKVVGEVIEELVEGNEPVPEPYSKRVFSGRFVVRMPTGLHQQLVIEAEREGVSLNQLVNIKLAAVELPGRTQMIDYDRSTPRIHAARVMRAPKRAPSKKAASRPKH